MIETWATLIGMAVITYATRAGGYLVMRGRRPSAYLTEVLRLAPLTLFAAMCVPTFRAATSTADLVGLVAGAAVVMALVRTRLGIAGALVLGVVTVALLR